MTTKRMESGYRVLAQYFSGHEDQRPLAKYPLTPAGLRQATTYAHRLGRSPQDRYHLSCEGQVDVEDFTAVVQEYRLEVRDVLAVTPLELQLVSPFDPGAGPVSDDQIRQVRQPPAGGHWPFWGGLFDGPNAFTGHDLTEADAVAFTREIESKVYRLVPVRARPLQVACGQFPDVMDVVELTRAVLDLSHEPGNVLAAQWLRASLDRAGEDRSADLGDFVVTFFHARQKVLDAILAASQDLVVRLPGAAREGFTRDLGIFIGDELVKSLLGQPAPLPVSFTNETAGNAPIKTGSESVRDPRNP
jgi:hypothetical protein